MTWHTTLLRTPQALEPISGAASFFLLRVFHFSVLSFRCLVLGAFVLGALVLGAWMNFTPRPRPRPPRLLCGSPRPTHRGPRRRGSAGRAPRRAAGSRALDPSPSA